MCKERKKKEQVRKCSLEFCDIDHYAKGYCKSHYAIFIRKTNKGIKVEDINFKPIREVNDTAVCKVVGCSRNGVAKGLCLNHYTQTYKGSQFEFKDEEEIHITRKATYNKEHHDEDCVAEGCKFKKNVKDYCSLHYRAFNIQEKMGIKVEDMEFKKVRKIKKLKICKIVDCERVEDINGYCRRHYQNKQYGKILTEKAEHEIEDFKYVNEAECCKIDFCDLEYRAKGYCSNHYNIYRKLLSKGIAEEDMVFRPVRLRKDIYICKEIDCGITASNSGYCLRHERQVREGKKLINKEELQIFKAKTRRRILSNNGL